MVDRAQIANALQSLNKAENERPNTTVEKISAAIDELMASDVEGWRNGVHVPDRETERAVERKAFGTLTDYNRVIEKTIIDPPLASIGWTIHGTFDERKVCAPGCSQFEFNDEGLIQRYWMYFNPEDFFYRS